MFNWLLELGDALSSIFIVSLMLFSVAVVILCFVYCLIRAFTRERG